MPDPEIDMPQPLSRVRPDATVVNLTPEALSDKPEMASLVTSIFALSSAIDHEIGLLLARILGANAAPALAIYATLRSQSLRMPALDAAARTVLKGEHYKVFDAVITAAEAALSDRHKLAHHLWATCPELPDALLLADPDHLNERIVLQERLMGAPPGTPISVTEAENAFKLDYSKILVYREGDISRAKRDLVEIGIVMFHYRMYLDPPISDEGVLRGGPHGLDPTGRGTRAGALRELLKLRLFREALGRPTVQGQNNPPVQP